MTHKQGVTALLFLMAFGLFFVLVANQSADKAKSKSCISSEIVSQIK